MTESPIVTDVKAEHPVKALLPIVVTESGIVTDIKLVQLLKA